MHFIYMLKCFSIDILKISNIIFQIEKILSKFDKNKFNFVEKIYKNFINIEIFNIINNIKFNIKINKINNIHEYHMSINMIIKNDYWLRYRYLFFMSLLI